MENKQIDKEPISQIEADEVASLDNNELSKEEQLQAQIEELEEKKASLLQKIEEAIAEQNQLSKAMHLVIILPVHLYLPKFQEIDIFCLSTKNIQCITLKNTRDMEQKNISKI